MSEPTPRPMQDDEALDRAYAWLLDDARGRLVLWDLLRVSGFLSAFDAVDPHISASYVARRTIGLHVWNKMLRVAPQSFLRMLYDYGPERDQRGHVIDRDPGEGREYDHFDGLGQRGDEAR